MGGLPLAIAGGCLCRAVRYEIKADTPLPPLPGQGLSDYAPSLTDMVLDRNTLSETVTRIVNGHLQSRLDELLPWAYPPAPKLRAVAIGTCLDV